MRSRTTFQALVQRPSLRHLLTVLIFLVAASLLVWLAGGFPPPVFWQFVTLSRMLSKAPQFDPAGLWQEALLFASCLLFFSAWGGLLLVALQELRVLWAMIRMQLARVKRGWQVQFSPETRELGVNALATATTMPNATPADGLLHTPESGATASPTRTLAR